MIRGIIPVSLSQLFLNCSEHFPPFVWFICAGENANVQAQNYVTETRKTESFSPDKMTETHVNANERNAFCWDHFQKKSTVNSQQYKDTQYSRSSTNSKFRKVVMFCHCYHWWHCQRGVNSNICLLLTSELLVSLWIGRTKHYKHLSLWCSWLQHHYKLQPRY